MKRKLLLLAPLVAVAATLVLHSSASARPEGTMPVRVDFSPGEASSGSPVTMTVTMSGNVSGDQNVGVTYNTVNGPATVTVPDGANTGTTTVYPSGSSGDTGTATASLNEGQASGTVTIQ